MSYVIQNFSNTNPSLIINQRNQLLFLFRTFYLILYWTVETYQYYLQYDLNRPTFRILQQLSAKLYTRGFTGMFQKCVKRWKFFISLNVNKSLTYWLFQKGNLFLTSSITRPIPKSLIIKKSNYHLNQMYLPFLISNISLHRKPFRVVVFKILHTLLLFWQPWTKHHTFTLKFFIGIDEVFLLYFYNMYIFKIYHL
jgi:hypothetical protein